MSDSNSKDLTFTQKLARVFDDNLETVQWKNVIDGVILFFIILSTLEVFLSTYSDLVGKYGTCLEIIDLVTTIFFTIEVTLRIWTCGELDERYRGFKGKIRYCFSFYGLIDILATYPFYINFFVRVPYTALKVLRICRIFRLFRYMKSFRLLVEAFKAKKQEMSISLQFLCIITFILSLILFFVENKVQPEVYSNGWKSALWAFAQYIGDPGGFAEYAPITVAGRIIACIVGVLGIAIFAVPAGLIGSAFLEVIEEHQKNDELIENSRKINEFMLVKSIRREGYIWPAKNLSFGDMKLDLGLTEDEIIKAVSFSKTLRIKNLASAILEGPKTDMLVVNQFFVNNDYGCHVERNSSVTIVNPLGPGENGLSYYAWHIALFGGFNYVSNELFSRTRSESDKRVNFYRTNEGTADCLQFQQFVDDITKDRNENDWIVIVAGEQVVKNAATDFHFEFGGDKGETSFELPNSTVHNTVLLKQLYDDFSKTMEGRTKLKTDAHQVQVTAKDNLCFYLKTKTKANVLLLNVSYNLMVFYNTMHASVAVISDVFNRNLERNSGKAIDRSMYESMPSDSAYYKKLYGLK